MPVTLNNIKKSYGTKKVLTGFSYTLEDNGIYCLMGPSGMGKTTLLRIMMGREHMDSGSISGVRTDEIAAMFQEDRLVPTLSAVENVALVSPDKLSPKELEKDLTAILPANSLRQPISELSGGMKRRVALARAMHYPCRMIILDEPFTGLDQTTRLNVISYLLGHRDGRILLVATHGQQDAALLGAKIIQLDGQQEEADNAREKAPVMTRTEIFRGMKMFRGIKEERYDAIIKKLEGYEREYRAGDIVWQQFERYAGVGIILAGAVHGIDNSREEPQIVQRFVAGSAFGEAVAFGGQNSIVEVCAKEPSRILFLPVENMLNNEDDPEIVHIMVNLLEDMSEKLSMLNLKNQMLSEPSLRKRILMYFRSLPADKNGVHFVPFNQKDLAQYLNANRSAINRELGRMKEEHIIEMERQNVKILVEPECGEI